MSNYNRHMLERWIAGGHEYEHMRFDTGELLAEVDRLRAENERLRQDAERYLFIVTGGAHVTVEDDVYVVTAKLSRHCEHKHQVDAVIDEAMNGARNES